jgi:MFS family permease
MTRTDPPTPPPVPRLRLGWLYAISPVSIAGVFAAGVANGTMWSLGPLFAERSGLSAGGVASFMTAIILGAALVQWPIGRIADRYDRRFVMLIAMMLAVAAEFAIVVYAKSPPPILIALAALIGAASLVLYPLSSSHAQDLGGRENAVEVSSALLLTYTIGAVIGPTTAAWLMGRIGPEALFLHNAVVHVVLVAVIVVRLWARPPKQESEV